VCAFSDYFGVRFQLATDEQVTHLLSHDKFKSMQAWPHNSSIAVIDDVIAIKLNYDPPAVIEYTGNDIYVIRSNIPDFGGDFLYAWYIYREGELIDTVWYERGLSSFEYVFSESGRYRAVMYIRTPSDEYLMPALSSNWVVVD